MKINTLEAQNYRNLNNIKANFDNINIFYGQNAQGKTNLIEALYLFTGNGSFRGNKAKELVNFDYDFAKLKIEFYAESRQQSAQIEIQNKITAYLNSIKESSYKKVGKVIKETVFSPRHLSMIQMGPIERRKFTDEALSQIKIGYSSLLSKYKKILNQRNNILIQCKDDKQKERELTVWDDLISKSGAKITYQRQKFIEKIRPIAKNIYSGLSSQKEIFNIFLQSGNSYEGLSCDEIEFLLKKELNKNKNSDIVKGFTQTGPHRDDIEITINGKSARFFGSQGQQRSCVIALKLAEARVIEIETGEAPVMLLDDVMSELDSKRKDYILNNIKTNQIFITGCDLNDMAQLKQGKVFNISGGVLKEM